MIMDREIISPMVAKAALRCVEYTGDEMSVFIDEGRDERELPF